MRCDCRLRVQLGGGDGVVGGWSEVVWFGHLYGFRVLFLGARTFAAVAHGVHLGDVGYNTQSATEINLSDMCYSLARVDVARLRETVLLGCV